MTTNLSGWAPKKPFGMIIFSRRLFGPIKASRSSLNLIVLSEAGGGRLPPAFELSIPCSADTVKMPEVLKCKNSAIKTLANHMIISGAHVYPFHYTEGRLLGVF